MSLGPALARIDLGAITENTRVLAGRCGSAQVMAVVKADGYGHGLLPVARATRAGGAHWLGVAQLREARQVRAGGDTGRLLSWLLTPGEDLAGAITQDIDLSASEPGILGEIAAAAGRCGRPARVHLKVDTGLTRGGAAVACWAELFLAARQAADAGLIDLVGLWSHLAWADDPHHATTDAQWDAFRQAEALAERHRVSLPVRHLANSAATVTRPDLHFDVVRPGLAIYGLSPIPGLSAGELGLRPAMTLVGRLALVKDVPSGTGVSYGHTFTTRRSSTLGLVPLGYADGIPRAASNAAEVFIEGARCPIVGRVCMDQFMVDLTAHPRLSAIRPGTEVVLFGAGDRGEPTAADWAERLGTISYEIVTRIGGRVPRSYDGEPTS
ncbi:MAG: alanine racemase [Angustibacter sp.]